MIEWDRRRFAVGESFTLEVRVAKDVRTLARYSSLSGDELEARIFAPLAEAATLSKDLDSGVSATARELRVDVDADELTAGVWRVEFWLSAGAGGPRVVSAGLLELVASGGAL